MSTMVIGLASGSVEKLLVASTLTGGAVALDMDVEIYLLLGGAYAFRKDVAGKGTYIERPELEEETAGRHRRRRGPGPDREPAQAARGRPRPHPRVRHGRQDLGRRRARRLRRHLRRHRRHRRVHPSLRRGRGRPGHLSGEAQRRQPVPLGAGPRAGAALNGPRPSATDSRGPPACRPRPLLTVSDHVGREVDARNGALGNERLDVRHEFGAAKAYFEHTVPGIQTKCWQRGLVDRGARAIEEPAQDMPASGARWVARLARHELPRQQKGQCLCLMAS